MSKILNASAIRNEIQKRSSAKVIFSTCLQSLSIFKFFDRLLSLLLVWLELLRHQIEVIRSLTRHFYQKAALLTATSHFDFVEVGR